jgi:hypothetical protein
MEMGNIMELIFENPMYVLGGVFLIILLVFFVLKKVFKIAMFIFMILITYAVYLFMTQDDPVEQIKAKLETGKAAVDKVDKATQDMREEAIDKIVDEVEEQLKEAAKQK